MSNDPLDLTQFEGVEDEEWLYRAAPRADWGEINFRLPDGTFGVLATCNAYIGRIEQGKWPDHNDFEHCRAELIDPVKTRGELMTLAPRLLVEVKALRELPARLVAAAKWGQMMAQMQAEDEGRSGLEARVHLYNNDHYCEMVDALKDAERMLPK